MSNAVVLDNPISTLSRPSRLRGLPDRGWLCACLIVCIAFALMISSAWDDSPCNDEPEHITAGYLCLTGQNYQLNCWHPPLVKDVAAFPLLFMNLKWPLGDSKAQPVTRTDIHRFFYECGNDAQTMVRTARIPLMLLAAAFLLWYYKRLREEYDGRTALTALVMLSASPTFLAHARFATNDIAAAAAFFACVTEFVHFLRKPSKVSFFLVGLLTAAAQLVKFSLVLLYPVYLLLGIGWIALSCGYSKLSSAHTPVPRALFKLTLQLAGIAFISLCVVWATYQWHTVNLPAAYQYKYNTVAFAKVFGIATPDLVRLTEGHRCLRGLSWYFTGLFAQGLHWHVGHPKLIYLLGKFCKGGDNPLYFPILFVTKEPAAFLLLLGLAGLVAAGMLTKMPADRTAWKNACREHFLSVSGVVFVTIYFAAAVAGNLNIGIRHLVPIFPFLYMLCAVVICRKMTASRGLERKWLPVVVVSLLGWGTLSSVSSWPGYLAYFNEFAGGKNNGDWIASSSNYDWDTDFLRLKTYLERQKIANASLIYSGPGNPYYYLGNLVRPLSLPDRPPAGQLIAIPLHNWQQIMSEWKGEHQLLMRDGHWRELPRTYEPSSIAWFCTLKPVGKAGDSILLFRAP